jgi:hypothetical protein
MSDQTAPPSLSSENDGSPALPLFLLAVVPAALFIALVLTHAGGIALDHLPESLAAQLAIVGSGAGLLLLTALWLDRREARRVPLDERDDAR